MQSEGQSTGTTSRGNKAYIEDHASDLRKARERRRHGSGGGREGGGGKRSEPGDVELRRFRDGEMKR